VNGVTDDAPDGLLGALAEAEGEDTAGLGERTGPGRLCCGALAVAVTIGAGSVLAELTWPWPRRLPSGTAEM
jgi:hypothetical protein